MKKHSPALNFQVVELIFEVDYYSFLGGVSYLKSTIFKLIFYFVLSFIFGFATFASFLTCSYIWTFIFLIALYLCIKRFKTLGDD
jgi:hypothetical protein